MFQGVGRLSVSQEDATICVRQGCRIECFKDVTRDSRLTPDMLDYLVERDAELGVPEGLLDRVFNRNTTFIVP